MKQCWASRTRSLFTAMQTGEQIPKTAVVALELCVAWEATSCFGRRISKPRQPSRAVKRSMRHCLRPGGMHCESEVCFCEVGQCPGKVPTLIYYDNQDSISWAEGGLRKFKHVELKYHFTQHLIQSGQAKVTYVPSGDNCADGLTKALAGSQFKKKCQGLCVV
jgi:hypothetical protein